MDFDLIMIPNYKSYKHKKHI